VTLRLALPDGALAAPSLALLAAARVGVAAAVAPPAAAGAPESTAAPAGVPEAAGTSAPAGERADPALEVQVTTVAADDVCAYLAAGAADAGLVAKDVLLERDTGLCELLDLRFGAALLLYAAAPGAPRRLARLGRLRVATRHPRLTRSFLTARGLQADVVAVAGELDRAVADGLADAVVTLAPPAVGGAPLALGDLVVEGIVAESSIRLVAARAARVLRADELATFVARLRATLPQQPAPAPKGDP
jgi:ATP phosphoribosyltransferase